MATSEHTDGSDTVKVKTSEKKAFTCLDIFSNGNVRSDTEAGRHRVLLETLLMPSSFPFPAAEPPALFA